MERILSLDISTKTGWALLVSSQEGFILEEYGQVPKVEMPDLPYPNSFVEWAYMCFGKIVELIDRLAPDILVIEETAGGSKNSHSQKILEFIHLLVAKLIKDTGIKCTYVLTEEWRRATGCKMTKEESKRNKEVKKQKEKQIASGIDPRRARAKDKDGKVVGKLGRKHINIRRANEIFGEFLSTPLRKKDEDVADALMLSYYYHVKEKRV